MRNTELADSCQPLDDLDQLEYSDREEQFRDPRTVQMPANFSAATKPGEVPYFETQHPPVGDPFATLDIVGYFNVR